ncbi:MAG: HEAT repeat domain-containing protein [Myxococcota bacterium]
MIALLCSLALAGDWRAALDARIAEARAADPAVVDAVYALRPARTRTGLPIFTGDLARADVSGAVFLDRFTREPDPALRVALLDAMATGDGWSEGVVALLPTERDAGVRRMMAEILADADPAFAGEGLRIAAQDGESAVRAAAFRALAKRDDADAALIVSGFVDPDATVRATAARAAGIRKVGWDALIPLLADPNAEVRRNAVRALERVDRVRVATLPEVAALLADPDPKVADAAKWAMNGH